MDAPVAPIRVLVCEADDEPTDGRVDGRAPGCWCWCLGPVACDESSVPSEHCFGFDDQERVPCSLAVHRRVEQGEECSIGVGELRPADLALENLWGRIFIRLWFQQLLGVLVHAFLLTYLHAEYERES